MSRFKSDEIAIFNKIGNAREIDENTWRMQMECAIIRVTKKDDGTYEVFCSDDDYLVQIVVCGWMLSQTMMKAMHRYKVQAEAVKITLTDMDNIGNMLFGQFNEV